MHGESVITSYRAASWCYCDCMQRDLNIINTLYSAQSIHENSNENRLPDFLNRDAANTMENSEFIIHAIPEIYNHIFKALTGIKMLR